MKPTLLLLLFLLIGSFSYGQGEARVWYFGDTAGIDFKTDPPTPLNDSKMHTYEGCASISDDNGNLLFYTDGTIVWDRFHDTMPNGSDLLGDFSSSQSAVVVKISPSLYYIFTIPNGSLDYGLNYSIVDITKNGGAGDVTTKNQNIKSGYLSEKIAIVQHSDGKRFWVVVKGKTVKEYYSYLVDGLNVNTTPVISTVGALNTINGIGYLKASPDQKKIVSVDYTEGVELFEFDNNTGKLSNAKLLHTDVSNKPSYGAEFSPNSKFLYVGRGGRDVIQYNVSLATTTAIKNSAYTLQGNSGAFLIGALQLGVDGKIYVSYHNLKTLAAIKKPNVQGAGCNFDPDYITLTRGKCRLGLPTFYSYYIVGPTLEITGKCHGDTTYFKYNGGDINSILSAEWNFGETGGESFTSKSGAWHIYTASKSYNYRLVLTYNNLVTDTLEGKVDIFPKPEISINDTIVCEDDTILVNLIPLQLDSAVWNKKQNSKVVKLPPDSTYVVELYRLGCYHADTFKIESIKKPEVQFGNDTSVCEGTVLTLDATSPGPNVTYLWSDGSTLPTLDVTQAGKYSVTITNVGCNDSYNEVDVSFKNPPTMFPIDTVLCDGKELKVEDNSWDSIRWADGVVSNTRTIGAAGAYTYTGYYLNCDDENSITVDYYPPLPQIGINDDVFVDCDSVNTRLDAKYEGFYELVWDDGTVGRYRYVDKPGIYSVTVTHECGMVYKEVKVKCQGGIHIPNSFTPNIDGRNEVFMPLGENIEVLNLQIFSRWGELIYSGVGPWDGKYNGKIVANGAYLYVVTYLEKDEIGALKRLTKGTLHVIR